MEEENQKEKKYTLVYTKDEIMKKIDKIQQSENLQLFLKTQEGAEEYDELVKLTELLEKKEKE